jgi:hypothetical protein
LQQGNSSSPSNHGGKSFKEVLAERNKQAQRRFRQRQKVRLILLLLHADPAMLQCLVMEVMKKFCPFPLTAFAGMKVICPLAWHVLCFLDIARGSALHAQMFVLP